MLKWSILRLQIHAAKILIVIHESNCECINCVIYLYQTLIYLAKYIFIVAKYTLSRHRNAQYSVAETQIEARSMHALWIDTLISCASLNFFLLRFVTWQFANRLKFSRVVIIDSSSFDRRLRLRNSIDKWFVLRISILFRPVYLQIFKHSFVFDRRASSMNHEHDTCLCSCQSLSSRSWF